MAIGLVRGATKSYSAAQSAMALLGVERAAKLAKIIVAVGLVQNLAALRTLASAGI